MANPIVTKDGGQWQGVARIFLKHIGHPLRPSSEDIGRYRKLILSSIALGPSSRALILGVTPELYELASELCGSVCAIDRSTEMIEHVWPGDPASVFCTDWGSLADLNQTFDLIVCDGGLHLSGFPGPQLALSRALQKSLKPHGGFVTRLFARPSSPETAGEVITALQRGEIASMNHLKLRLGNALQPDPATGVRLGDVWDVLHQALQGSYSVFDQLGWDRNEVRAIDFYKDSDARYHFSHADETIEMFTQKPVGMTLSGAIEATYPMGNQFPVVAFRNA